MSSANERAGRSARILVVDDNESLCRLLSAVLRVEGFEAFTVTNAQEAIPAALEHRPDLILLDVMMPRIDGLEICRRLREMRQTRYTCVILVTAKVSTADKVAGLRAGADDYLTKPFDSGELVERIRSTLRRSTEMKGLNPLTGLPGNDQIRLEAGTRLVSGRPTALLHVDIDSFKAFNDHYGFMRGDGAITLLADCCSRVVADSDPDGFVGHIGGDDFAVIVNHEIAERTAERVIERWDARARDLYDPADLERGYIEVHDRRGRLERYGPLTISIGIASDRRRTVTSELEMADIATEMKQQAKQTAGSSWAIDRRATVNRDQPPRTPGRQVVLVVDDEPDVRSMVKAALVDRFDVIEAADGMEGYLVALNRRPRWVLLDHMMPELQGRYAADLIRERVPDVTIVAFSAALDEKPPWADALILKSSSIGAAFARIVKTLEHKEQRH